MTLEQSIDLIVKAMQLFTNHVHFSICFCTEMHYFELSYNTNHKRIKSLVINTV